MRTFITTKPVTLRSGVIGLSLEQASGRSFGLTALGEGLFRIMLPMQFKAGESFTYDGREESGLVAEVEVDCPSEIVQPCTFEAFDDAPVLPEVEEAPADVQVLEAYVVEPEPEPEPVIEPEPVEEEVALPEVPAPNPFARKAPKRKR